MNLFRAHPRGDGEQSIPVAMGAYHFKSLLWHALLSSWLIYEHSLLLELVYVYSRPC